MSRTGGTFLYALVIGFGTGITGGLLFNWGMMIEVGALIIGGISILFSRAREQSSRAIFLLCAAVLAMFSFGIIRADLYTAGIAQETVSNYFNQPAVALGTIIADPDRRGTSLRIMVQTSKINTADARGVILATVSRDEHLSYGDRVDLRGSIEAPQSFAGEDGREFDYPDYLRVHGIAALMPRASILAVHPSPWSPRKFLFSLKHSFEGSLERLFPEPTASVMEGVLLGQRHGLPPALTAALIAAGLIHIVILAGYALSIVADSTLRGLSFLPRNARLIAAALLLVGFVVMTGAAATTVRAMLMALIAIMARYLNRTTVALRSLALVAAGMILVNPPIILYDVSFIISVIATFGLITVSPAVEARLARLRIFQYKKMADARSIAASTISIQIFALPALLYFTGNLSLVSVPANLLALPVLPWVMAFGFASGMLGFLSPFLAFVPAAIADLLLHWILLVAQVSAAIPLGASTISAFTAWVVILVYIPLTAWAVRLYKKGERVKK